MYTHNLENACNKFYAKTRRFLGHILVRDPLLFDSRKRPLNLRTLITGVSTVCRIAFHVDKQKLSGIKSMKTCSLCTKEWPRNLSDIKYDELIFKFGEAPALLLYRETVPKSPMSCVNRNPVRYSLPADVLWGSFVTH